MGGYVQGQDPDLDKALALLPEITKFLQQDENEICRLNSSQKQLKELLEHKLKKLKKFDLLQIKEKLKMQKSICDLNGLEADAT